MINQRTSITDNRDGIRKYYRTGSSTGVGTNNSGRFRIENLLTDISSSLCNFIDAWIISYLFGTLN